MKNIQFDKSKSNHIYFLNQDISFSDYLSTTSICSDYMEQYKWEISVTASPTFKITTTKIPGISVPTTNSSASLPTSTDVTILTTTHHANNDITTANVVNTTKTVSITVPSETSFRRTSIWIYIGPSLGAILIIIVLFIFWRLRRKRKQQKNNSKWAQRVVIKRMQGAPIHDQLSNNKRQKYFIDTKMILIHQNKILGKGSKSLVYEGNFMLKLPKTSEILSSIIVTKMSQTENKVAIKVAVKIPSKFLSSDDVEEFVRELDALIKVGSHPCIISFYGWTLHNHIPSLITEQAKSDLLQYVRILRGSHEFPLKDILIILWQITQALEHLASLSIIHRDIACRNILLSETGEAKVADFGLCCHCDESFIYRGSLQKRLPIKWLSIESLIDRIFSEKTDVWAFGILCFEVFSYGSDPYPTLANMEILTFLLNGKRMEKPDEKTPNEIYDLMLQCWLETPSERPNFKELSEILRTMIENVTSDYGYLTLKNVNFDE